MDDVPRLQHLPFDKVEAQIRYDMLPGSFFLHSQANFIASKIQIILNNLYFIFQAPPQTSPFRVIFSYFKQKKYAIKTIAGHAHKGVTLSAS